MSANATNMTLLVTEQTLTSHFNIVLIEWLSTLAYLALYLLYLALWTHKQVILEYLCQLLMSLLQQSLPVVHQLIQRDVEILENEAFLPCEPILLNDIGPQVTLDHVKDLMQLPSLNHELVELVLEHYLWMLGLDLDDILALEEDGSQLADWFFLHVVVKVEETRNDELFLAEAAG